MLVVFLAAVLLVEAFWVVVFLADFSSAVGVTSSTSVESAAACLLLDLVDLAVDLVVDLVVDLAVDLVVDFAVVFVDLVDLVDFFVLALAAIASRAVSRVMPSTVCPSGNEAFTLPYLM